MDDYLDEFVELIAEAGYIDLKIVVVKFWKGLDPQIQNTIVTMAYGHPSDSSLENWYEAANNIDQNHAANEAFKTAYRTPISTRPLINPLRTIPQSLLRAPPAPYTLLTLSSSTHIDTGVVRKKEPTPMACYRCHQPGHKAPDCPLRFDIRLLTNEELENELMNKKDVPPVQDLDSETEPEIPKEEDFVRDNE